MEIFTSHVESELAKAKDLAGGEKVAVVARWVDQGETRSEFVGYAEVWKDVWHLFLEGGYSPIWGEEEGGVVKILETDGLDTSAWDLPDGVPIVFCVNAKKDIPCPRSFDQYKACKVMLKEILAQRRKHVPNFFLRPMSPERAALCAEAQHPRQSALYAASIGLAEATVKFAASSEGYYETHAEQVHYWASNPEKVVEMGRRELAYLVRVVPQEEMDEDGF